jgi:hypothetical protein
MKITGNPLIDFGCFFLSVALGLLINYILNKFFGGDTHE